MRIRQIALVGEDLAAAKADIVDVLGLGGDYADPGVGHFGLHNAVWPIGDTFLEVVSPTQEGTTAGRLLDKRGGDGGYMVILQIDGDMAGTRKRMADIGVRVVHQTDRDDGKVAYSHLHPRDVGAHERRGRRTTRRHRDAVTSRQRAVAAADAHSPDRTVLQLRSAAGGADDDPSGGGVHVAVSLHRDGRTAGCRLSRRHVAGVCVAGQGPRGVTCPST